MDALALDTSVIAELGSRTQRDPLSFRRPSSWGQRALVHYAAVARADTYWHSGNAGGKAQPLDEPVLTPEGWRQIGSLVVGDVVLAGDGTPTRVLATYPQGRLPVYRVTFDDGAWTRCSYDHLWTVQTHSGRFKHGRWEVWPLSRILARYDQGSTSARHVVVPRTPTVEQRSAPVPLDPYLLGVLLGDGHLGRESVMFSTADLEVADSVALALPPGCKVRKVGAGPDFAITTGKVGGDHRTRTKNLVLCALRDLKLAGLLSWEKHVPEIYLHNDAATRCAILQGLLDTDGSVDGRCGTIEFTSTSQQLAADVAWLARSLGGRARVAAPRITRYEYRGEKLSGRPSWRVAISHLQCDPFRIPRKLERWQSSERGREHRMGGYQIMRSIVEDGMAECVCIAVEHPDATYLTRDCIVTHNTFGGVALDTALLVGRRELWGIELPYLKPPVVGALIVESYKIAEDSSVQALLELIGDVPHKVGTTGGVNRWTSVVYVRHPEIRSDNYEDWSKVTLFPHEGELPEGIRLDFAHADEPAPARVWDAIRHRGRGGGRPFLRYTTATPTERATWGWYMTPEEFEHALISREEFEQGTGRPRNRRVRIQTSVFDNNTLTEEDFADKRAMAAGSPLERARLYGDHVDVTGKNPLDQVMLATWEGRCRAGEDVPVQIQVKVNRPGARETRNRVVTYREFFPPEPDEFYYLPLDPSSGVDDRLHDPAAFHVYACRAERLVAVFEGALGPYGLGQLAGIVGWRYGGEAKAALVDPEMSGGWGEAVLDGLGDLGYWNISQDVNEEQNDKLEPRLGFRTTPFNRGDLIGAVDKLLFHDAVIVPDIRVVSCLKNVIVNEKGKVEAAPGRHDEHLILLGRYGVRRPTFMLPERRAPKPVPFERLVDEMNGRMPARRRSAQQRRVASRFKAPSVR